MFGQQPQSAPSEKLKLELMRQLNEHDHLWQHINKIKQAADQKHIATLLEAVKGLGVYLMTTYKTNDQAKLDEQIAYFIGYISKMPLPPMEMITGIFQALNTFYLDEKISETAGIAMNSELNALKVGINSFAFLMNEKGRVKVAADKVSEAITNDHSESTIKQIKTNVSTTMDFAMEYIQIKPNPKIMSALVSSLSSLLDDAKHSEQKEDELLDQILLAGYKLVVDQHTGQVAPDIKRKLMEWIPVNPVISVFVTLQKMKDIAPSLFFMHASRLILKTLEEHLLPPAKKRFNERLKNQWERTLMGNRFMPAKLFALHSHREKEKYALSDYAKSFVMHGHDAKAITEICDKFKLSGHKLYYKDQFQSLLTFSFSSVNYTMSGDALLQYFCETYPNEAEKIYTTFTDRLKRGALDADEFVNSIKILRMLGKHEAISSILSRDKSLNFNPNYFPFDDKIRNAFPVILQNANADLQTLKAKK